MIPVAIVAAAVAHAHASPGLFTFGHLMAAGEFSAALVAIGSVGVFFWTRLRLDRAWRWLFKHIKEDQKRARMSEFLEAQVDPRVALIRKTELMETINPELQNLHTCLDRVGETVKSIAEEQSKVAADLALAKLKVEQVASDLSTAKTRVEHVADVLVESNAKVDGVVAHLALSEVKRAEEIQVVAEHIVEDEAFQGKTEAFQAQTAAFQERVEELLRDQTDGTVPSPV